MWILRSDLEIEGEPAILPVTILMCFTAMSAHRALEPSKDVHHMKVSGQYGISGKIGKTRSSCRQTVWDPTRRRQSETGQAKPNQARLSQGELGNNKPNRAEPGRAQPRPDPGWAERETSPARLGRAKLI